MEWFSSNHWFVYFDKVSFQHIGLLEKTWGLRSVFKVSSFRSYFSDFFLEEALKLSANIFPANFCTSYWVFPFRSIFSAFLSIVFGLSVMSKLDSILRAPFHSWGSLWWLNISYVCEKKSFLLQAAYWEVCYLTSFLLVSWRRRFRRAASLHFKNIFVYPYLIMLCEEERIKWR